MTSGPGTTGGATPRAPHFLVGNSRKQSQNTSNSARNCHRDSLKSVKAAPRQPPFGPSLLARRAHPGCEEGTLSLPPHQSHSLRRFIGRGRAMAAVRRGVGAARGRVRLIRKQLSRAGPRDSVDSVTSSANFHRSLKVSQQPIIFFLSFSRGGTGGLAVYKVVHVYPSM